MPGIDPRVICHRLAIDPKVQLVAQKEEEVHVKKIESSNARNREVVKS